MSSFVPAGSRPTLFPQSQSGGPAAAAVAAVAPIAAASTATAAKAVRTVWFRVFGVEMTTPRLVVGAGVVVVGTWIWGRYASTVFAVMRDFSTTKMILEAATLGDMEHDVQLEEVYRLTDQRLSGPTGPAYRVHRRRHIRGYEPKHLQPGDALPDVPVYTIDGEKATLKQCVQIAAIEGGSKASIHRGKVAIIFGSYSCPVWRGAAAKLSTVAFFTRGIPVLHIYTKEAHPSDRFPSPINERELVSVTEHDSLEVRCETAKFAKYHLDTQLAEQVPYAMLVDGMDNALEELFETVPYRVAVVDAETMKLFYISQLGPFNPAGKHMDAIAALLEVYQSKTAAAEADGVAVDEGPDVTAALAEALSTAPAAEMATAATDNDTNATTAAAAAAARTAARTRYYAKDTPIDADSLLWMLAQTSANNEHGMSGSTPPK